MPVVAGFAAGLFGFGIPASAAMMGGWWAGAGIASTVLGGLAAKLLATTAMSALTRALAPGTSQGGGITISPTLRGEDNPETIILGRYATAGHAIAPPYSHGKSNAYLTHVVELCSAPGERLERVMIGDEWVELGPDPHPEYGRLVQGPHQGRIWIKYHDGSQTLADPMLRARYGSHPDRP